MHNLIIILNLISLTFSAFLALYAFRIKNNSVAFSFFLLMSIFSFWGAIKIVDLFVHVPVIENIFSHTLRAITTFTPALILFIVIRYTKYPAWFNREHSKYFFAIPGLLAFLSVLISLHQFLNEYFSIRLLPMYNYGHPDFLNIYLFYLYACLSLSLFILFQRLFGSSYLFKKQLVFIIIAIALPAINDIFFRFNISLIPGYHLTPEMFIVGNVFFAWALFGYRFLKLTPVTNDLVINSIDDVMITINSDHLLIDLNKSCEVKFNLKSRQIIGESFIKVFDRYPQLINFYKNGKGEELNLNIENRNYYFSGKKSIIEYPEKEVFATVILLHDVTETKQAEQKIKDYSRKLEQMNTTKDKFFSIIGHDLRNPFTAVISISDILVNDYDSMKKEEIVSMLESIKKTSEKGYNLLQNLLEWARMQTNSIAYEPMPLKLYRMVDQASETEKILAFNKNITISTQVDEDIAVYADMNMLNTVLRNILSNAIKFTKRNGLINISSRILANSMVEITIADNGVGISSSKIDKLFRIDSKFTTPGTDNESGSALGLILCKEFVEKNGGKIRIESTVNAGTKVHFTLPYSDFPV